MTDQRDNSTSERWQRVKEVFTAALERAPAERAAFLDEACGTGDAVIRREVEALLAAHQAADSFLETPAAAVAASLSPSHSGLAEGQALGPYRVLRVLGQGGMAIVYLARDERHHRSVALKVLHPDLAHALGPERFLREIEVAANLSHPHILPLFDSGEVEGFLYYVMPYVEGESLRDRLRRETQLPVDEALQLGREVADALAYAHGQGVIHRDIKPENILLSGGHALVADFGIARALGQVGSARLTETGMAVGTAAYMSPEQASAASHIDGRSDVYSLGCVVYEMLVGEPPYTGPTPQAIIAKRFSDPVPRVRRLRPSVPEGMDHVVTRALAPVPADRFATAAELAKALQSIDAALDHRPRRRMPVAAPALGLGFLIGLGVLFAWRHSHRGGERPRSNELRTLSIWDQQERKLTPARVLRWNSCGDCGQSPVEMPNVRGAPDWLASVGDTLLIVSQPNLGLLMSYNGERWRMAARYDRRRFSGGLRLAASLRDTLLAFTIDTGSGGSIRVYRWGQQGLSRSPPIRVGARSSAVWTDRDLVIGTDSGWFLHGNDGQWLRRNGGSAPISHIWGAPGEPFYAIGSFGSHHASDSLLTFDGHRWKQVDIRPDTALRASYRAGRSLDDGSVLVAGSVCDSMHCRPLLLRLLPHDSTWREVPLPGMAALRLYDVWGDDHEDFYLGGASAFPAQPDGVVCGLGMTCLVHMVRGRAKPELEVSGRRPVGMARLRNRMYVLFGDGTLWRYAGREFQYETEVPGLELRDVSANAVLGVSAVGTDGSVFGLLQAGTSYAAVDTASPAQLYRRLIVLDTAVALLNESGEVFSSHCVVNGTTLKGAPFWIECARPLERLKSPDRRHINDIAVSEDGTLVGVGDQGLVASWISPHVTTAHLPAAIDKERLIRVVARPGLPLIALGEHVILEGSQAGQWKVQRKLLDQEVGRATDLTVTQDGVLVVSADPLPGHWRLTLYGPASSTRTILEDVGMPPRIRALPDGRIVLAHSYPADRTFGGWLTVLSSTHDSTGVRVDLPIKMDAYGLADDGKNLYVAGSGLQIARISLDSLN
jgi:tRNA A-37 threonylcarbamoyl transferase component Bud32